jgi:hypothetical protein
MFSFSATLLVCGGTRFRLEYDKQFRNITLVFLHGIEEAGRCKGEKRSHVVGSAGAKPLKPSTGRVGFGFVSGL